MTNLPGADRGKPPLSAAARQIYCSRLDIVTRYDPGPREPGCCKDSDVAVRRPVDPTTVKRTHSWVLTDVRRNIVPSLIVLSLIVSFDLVGTQDDPRTVPGITNFARVNNRLYRGAQPNGDGISSLARLGVRTIINLRMTNDVWSAEEAEARALGITYTNVPMSGIGRPTDDQVAKVLSIIETGSNPVFVHCQRGADRTGTIIACYRIQHDKWSSKQALQEAKEHGMSALEIGMRHYVAEFEKSHKAD
jgi:tyrosine-protein phosphatase SIW14